MEHFWLVQVLCLRSYGGDFSARRTKPLLRMLTSSLRAPKYHLRVHSSLHFAPVSDDHVLRYYSAPFSWSPSQNILLNEAILNAKGFIRLLVLEDDVHPGDIFTEYSLQSLL